MMECSHLWKKKTWLQLIAIKPIKTNYGLLKQSVVISDLTDWVQIGRFIICNAIYMLCDCFQLYTIIVPDTYPNRADLF